jgi:NADPH:quinone reductase-like Zn-dependent oxidoreductase
MEDVPLPDHSENDIVIDVKTFALNYVDIWVRRGGPNSKLPFPHIGGTDASGIISKIGSKWKERFSIGDHVLVNPGFSCFKCKYCLVGQQSMCTTFKIFGAGTWGGAAEQAIIPGTNVHKIPDTLSFEEAAAAPLTFVTAYRMLRTKANVKEGEKVLVTGAGGGVGTAAVQMAKEMGATVIALTSTEKIAKLTNLGVDYCLDYKKDADWDTTANELTGGIDVVIDSVGEATWEKSIDVLAKGGRLASCGVTTGNLGKTQIRSVFAKQLTIYGSYMGSNSDFLAALSMLYSGKVRPIIDSTRPLEQMSAAHTLLESGKHFGKVVLTI